MFASAVLLSTLISSVFASVYIINPVQSTSYTGGSSANVAWQDDGNSPSLSSWGNASVGIYVGNRNQQTLVQTIVSSVDVSQVSSINFIPDPSIGPDGSDYFIRIESLKLKDSSSGFPQESFSALFTLTGMSGKFNSSVSAEIAGESTAPIGASTSAGSGSGSPTIATTPTSGAALTVAAAATTSTSSSNAAVGSSVVNVWVAGLAAVVLALML